MTKKITVSLLILAACILMFGACGDSVKIPTDAIISKDTSVSDGYFYGIVESNGKYYAQFLSDYIELPEGSEYLYLPLSDDVYSVFHENGVDGAWSVLEYHTAEELFDAVSDSKVTIGAHFTYSVSHGSATLLYEYNFYEDGGVDIANGEALG